MTPENVQSQLWISQTVR